MQPIDQVGGTIFYRYFEIVLTTTLRIRLRKAGIDDFFNALTFVWLFVALNIQPYWIFLTFYLGALSWQSCSCSVYETIPSILKILAVGGMRWVCTGQVSVASVKSAVSLTMIN